MFAIKLRGKLPQTSQLLCFFLFFVFVFFVFLEKNINRLGKANVWYIWPNQKAEMSSQRLSIEENHNSF